ncbi:hemerythrin domain-containing protein [Agromyces aurantiacus]|uniref:Hemerythrin domain-containing protein n=1 Tax=Agromyces aurantiacus TaxID=165814 RepID=A0ABV9R6P2_9MICO|nr:hemerythrin domain-containing protein [Agromyces aurantiacus]MBM7503815.1 hypothetical protein [Agromyces aurantiacus]
MSDFFTMHPGETAAPVPDGPVLCPATPAMRRVHRVFLWAYDEAPGLARSAADGDTERSRYVGEVLGNFDKLLHVHHEGEDLYMYPQLGERAPGCAVHIAQMLAQHEQVKGVLDELAPIREQWRDSADAELGEQLAAGYERLSAMLKEHLRREVTEVTPAVEKVLTQEEFEKLASHGVDAFEKKVVLAYLGMILATNPPEDQKAFLMDIPLPIRLAYRLVGKRLYREQYSTLFPGREIPRTL